MKKRNRTIFMDGKSCKYMLQEGKDERAAFMYPS